MPYETVPALILAGRTVEFFFSHPNPTVDVVRLRLLAAPTGSARAKDLESGSVALHEASIREKFRTSFDKGGRYKCSLEYIASGRSPGGPGYSNQDEATAIPVVVESVDVDVDVGQKLTQQLGFGANTAQLAVMVWGDRIERTTIAEHGIATPATERPSSTIAEISLANPALIDAIALLGGTEPDSGFGVILDAYQLLVVAYQAHLSSTHHAVADDSNGIPTSSHSPQNAAELANGIAKFREVLVKHAANIHRNPTTGGPGADGKTGSHASVDSALTRFESPGPNPTDPLSLVVSLAELFTLFGAHVARPIHSVPGPVAPSASGVLLIQKLFLESLFEISSTAPATKHPATVLLVKQGFKES